MTTLNVPKDRSVWRRLTGLHDEDNSYSTKDTVSARTPRKVRFKTSSSTRNDAPEAINSGDFSISSDQQSLVDHVSNLKQGHAGAQGSDSQATLVNNINSKLTSIWDQAYDALKAEDNQLINKYEELLLKTIAGRSDGTVSKFLDNKDSGIFDVTRRQSYLDYMASKGLEQTKGQIVIAGHVISVQDSLKKLNEGIGLTKDWIDAAVQASPQASVAWSIVCLALPLLSRPAEANEANTMGFTYVSSRMQYYIAMESLLIPIDQDGVQVQEYMRLQLTKLYQSIIDFQIKSILRFHQGVTRTIADDIRGKHDWKSMLDTIKTSEDLIHKDFVKLNAGDSRSIFVKLLESALESQSIMQHLQESLQWVEKRELRFEERECLQLFCLEPAYTFFKAQIPERVAGTCNWFLSQQLYKDWLARSDGTVLLVSADPGCGKSVLARHLIDVELPKEHPEAVICYFFFKDQHQDKLATALCAILHQLLTPELMKYALPAYGKYGKTLKDNVEVLFEILCNTTQDQSAKQTILVLDAMDECDPNDTRRLFRLLETHGKKFKTLLTSRPYDNIISNYQEQDGPTSVRIRIPGELESDVISQEINLVIKHRLDILVKRKPRRLDERTKLILEEKLSKIEHRTYLWIYMVFDELERVVKKSARDLEQYLKRIPHDVNDAYERILAKVAHDEDSKSKAYRILQIILAAERPLSITELQIAFIISDSMHSHDDLDLEDDEDFEYNVRNWCGLIVHIHHGKVTFLHQTAREFLLSKQNSAQPDILGYLEKWSGSIELGQAHKLLTQSCISYLLLTEFEDGQGGKPCMEQEEEEEEYEEEGEDFPFLNYSALFWHQHFERGQCHTDETVVDKAIELCTPSGKRFTAWTCAAELYFLNFDREPQLLGIICSLSAKELVRLLLDKVDIRTDFLQGEEALLVACQYNRIDNVKLLLDHGAKLNCQDIFGRTPLMNTAQADLVELLLHHGADPNIFDFDGNFALKLAASKKGSNVISLLLSYGANINQQDHDGHAALHCALFRPQEHSTFDLLLANGANVNLPNYSGRTPIFLTLERNKDKYFVENLIKYGAEVNIVDIWGESPLFLALNDHELTALLLRSGALVDVTNKLGETPLHIACVNGSRTVVETLLNYGANPNTKDSSGSTPLHLAAKNGHEQTVDLLCQHGADLSIVNADGLMGEMIAALEDFPSIASVISKRLVKRQVSLSDLQQTKPLWNIKLSNNQQIQERCDEVLYRRHSFADLTSSRRVHVQRIESLETSDRWLQLL